MAAVEGSTSSATTTALPGCCARSAARPRRSPTMWPRTCGHQELTDTRVLLHRQALPLCSTSHARPLAPLPEVHRTASHTYRTRKASGTWRQIAKEARDERHASESTTSRVEQAIVSAERRT